jgi:tRNA threonylcarbamoyladenosine biosynthesis protein TsaB
MSILLNIETATSVCSVAVSQNGKVIASRESDEHNVHAEKLMVFIQESLAEAGIKLQQIDAIAVGSGPGSYTGLRIGTSTAKGLCYGLSKPLIVISTLKAMAFAAMNKEPKKASLFCPMIDARRMEVYTALYDNSGKEILPVNAKIIDESSFSEYLTNKTVVFFGDGMPKIKEVFADVKNVSWIEGMAASAQNLAPLAEEAFAKSDFADLAYYEPFYLKEFVAKKSAKQAGL